MQSFDDAKLSRLERGHSGRQAQRVIAQAAEKFGNVSIDLIFAAPRESASDWQSDLATALSLPIAHLSTYALTFEKGTAFWGRRLHSVLEPIQEETEVEMYRSVMDACREAGWEHYEISNFARPGFQCRHNVAYWSGRGWYAGGPGAARFVEGRREVNHRGTSAYLHRMERGKCATAESESITTIQYARERAAFGIRMLEGIELEALSRETGVDVEQVCGEALQRSVDDGLLEAVNGRFRLTDRGVLFADSVAAALLG